MTGFRPFGLTFLSPPRLLLAALSLAWLAACASPSGPSEVTEVPQRVPTVLRITILGGFVSAGETVPVQLENLSDREIEFNLCLEQEWERWTGRSWVSHEIDRAGSTCTLDLHTVSPGETVIHDLWIQARDLPRGIYRIVFGSVRWGDAEGESALLPREDRTTNSVEAPRRFDPKGQPGGVEVVLAGRVVDPAGAPIESAVVVVRTRCAPDPPDPCGVSTTLSTNEAGRFITRFDHGSEEAFPATAEVSARPPIGRGYVLGSASREGIDVEYQPIPASDTTFVRLTLPSRRSASRAPEWVRRASPSGLVVDSQRIYGSGSCGAYALDRFTGEALWCEGRGPRFGPLFVVARDVVVTSVSGVLRGFRTSTGELLWTRGDVPSQSLVAAEDHGLAATDGSTVAAYDPETGATRWRVPMEDGGGVNMALGSGLACAERLVVPPGDARIECWDAATGEALWSRFVGSPAWIVIVGDRLVLAGGETERESGWIGLDARTGETVWKSPVPANRGPALSESGEVVYACSGSECLAVETRDGSVLWRRAFEGQEGGPAVARDRLYVLAADGSPRASLLVLDAASGATRERIDPDPFDDSGFFGTPAGQGDRVYVHGAFDHLYAFRLE